MQVTGLICEDVFTFILLSFITIVSFYTCFSTGEKYFPENLWGGSNAVPSWRRGQAKLLLQPAVGHSSQSSSTPQEQRYLLYSIIVQLGLISAVSPRGQCCLHGLLIFAAFPPQAVKDRGANVAWLLCVCNNSHLYTSFKCLTCLELFLFTKRNTSFKR